MNTFHSVIADIDNEGHSQVTKHGEENHIINTTQQKEEPGGIKDIVQNWTSGGHPGGTIGEV
jgi:hypothetical protein